MDFELTQEQKAIQKAAWDFANGEFTKEIALECDHQRRFPTELHKRACQLGLLGVHYPKEYGGQGYGVLEHLMVIENMCRKDPGLGIAIGFRAVGSETILRFGTDEQKKKYLPKITAGELTTGIGLTEPEHGSDVVDLGTTAIRDGNEYVINGVKTFITNGMDADIITIVCKTDPEAKPTHRGMSLIMVERNRPGFKAEDLGNKMGQRMLLTAHLTFDNVRVPVANLLGVENKGFYHVMEFFNEVRMGVAAQALGGAQAAFDRTVAWVKQRRQFGQRLADLQVTQHKLADMATKIETARLLLYKAGWTHDNKGVNPTLASMAKLYAARAAVEVCEEAIQLFGGYGYFEENEVERIYRDIRITEIYEGTKEVQKNTIASFIVGREK